MRFLVSSTTSGSPQIGRLRQGEERGVEKKKKEEERKVRDRRQKKKERKKKLSDRGTFL